MSTNNESATKSTAKKKETPAQMLARLQAELAAAQEAVKVEQDANREKVDAYFAKLPECLAKLGIEIAEGEKPLAVFARMVATYAKHATVYPARLSANDGERKTMVRLTDEQWKEADAMLIDETEPSIGKRADAVAVKFGIAKQSAYQRYYTKLKPAAK